MTREQKVTKAKELRGKGATYREIGERLGVKLSTAYRLLNDRREYDRQYREANRDKRRAWDREQRIRSKVPCPQCGQKMGPESELCLECRKEDRHTRRHTRCLQIVEWWAEGIKAKEIADRLGWSPEQLGPEFHKMRSDGYDLPYRRKVYGGRTSPRFPDQVPA